jgi:hypothetical protein
LVVAAALVITAAVVVLGAVLSASLTFVTIAAVLALALGTAAARITHAELLQSRRDAAGGLARQAQDYRELAEQRSIEQREFVEAMGSRVGKAERATMQLESAVLASQARAAATMRRLNAETRRADLAEAEGNRLAVALEESEERSAEALVRVAELENENDVLRTENDALRTELDIATSWPQAGTA